jgi:hypothetical protein
MVSQTRPIARTTRAAAESGKRLRNGQTRDVRTFALKHGKNAQMNNQKLPWKQKTSGCTRERAPHSSPATEDADNSAGDRLLHRKQRKCNNVLNPTHAHKVSNYRGAQTNVIIQNLAQKTTFGKHQLATLYCSGTCGMTAQAEKNKKIYTTI